MWNPFLDAATPGQKSSGSVIKTFFGPWPYGNPDYDPAAARRPYFYKPPRSG